MRSASLPLPDPARLAFVCAVLPVLAVHACYALAWYEGHLPACVPYVSGCVSISATGRYGLAYFVFKLTILPTAVLLAAFWLLASHWIAVSGDTSPGARRAILGLGVTAAAFLALYTVFLGHKGDFYNLMRRFGVTLYFGCSYLAALVLVYRIERLAQRSTGIVPARLRRGMLVLVIALLALGLGSIPVSNFIADKNPVENAIEWLFTLLLFSFYGLVGLAFRATGFRIEAGRDSPA